MNLFKKKQSKAVTPMQIKSHSGLSGGGFYEAMLGYPVGGVITASQAMEFYRNSSSVSQAVDLIAGEIEKIEPVLRLPDGTLETNSPILDMLRTPNGYQTRDEFIGQIARNWLLTHGSLLYAEGTIRQPPRALWSVKPQAITVQQNNDDGYPQLFSVNTGVGKGNFVRDFSDRRSGWRFLDGTMRQVYNIAGYSSRSNDTHADSPLAAISKEIQQQIAGRTHNLALLRNGARVSLVAVFKDDLGGDDQLMARSQALNEGLAGAANAGKIAVVTAENLELKELSKSNKDMDYLNLDDVARKAIFSRYRIPLPLIDNAASTFNNMAESTFHFYDMAVLPNFQRLYNGLGKMLLPRYGLDPAQYQLTYNTNDIESLRNRKIEVLGKMINDKAITINEYRDSIGMEPVEGGEVIYDSATHVPIGETFTLDDAGVGNGR